MIYTYTFTFTFTYTMTSGDLRGAIMDFETTSRHLLPSSVKLKDSEALKLVHSATLCSHRLR